MGSQARRQRNEYFRLITHPREQAKGLSERFIILNLKKDSIREHNLSFGQKVLSEVKRTKVPESIVVQCFSLAGMDFGSVFNAAKWICS
jgi:hypothetical protein